ncbi:MAG: ABC transporter permease [Anaerolineae bacterium]|mgnify:CR=1 FL=1
MAHSEQIRLAGQSVATIEVPSRHRSLWYDAFQRLLRNKAAVVGLGFILFVVVVAIFADALAPYSYRDQDLRSVYQPPSGEHPLGTNQYGKDVLSLLIYGARVSITVGLVAQLIIILVGVPIGAISGFLGGRVDMIIMRFVDIMYAFPDLLLIIIVMTFIKGALPKAGGLLAPLARLNELTGGLLGVFIALGLTWWLTVARLVRGQILSLKERDYILAARAVGVPTRRIMVRHLIPNALAPVIVAATLGVPQAIMMEAGLSFIGMGVDPPTPSWGMMIQEGAHAIRGYPYLVLSPAAAIALTMLSFNFLGDGLRDALDPGMKDR